MKSFILNYLNLVNKLVLEVSKFSFKQLRFLSIGIYWLFLIKANLLQICHFQAIKIHCKLSAIRNITYYTAKFLNVSFTKNL